MRMRAITKLVLLAAGTVGAGCGHFTDALSLQRTLVHQFHTDAISVNVSDGTVLTVRFTNSDAVMLAGPDRAAFSRQVAEYVRDHYRDYGSLSRITVGFARVHKAGPVILNDTTESYSFNTADLGAPRDTTRVEIRTVSWTQFLRESRRHRDQKPSDRAEEDATRLLDTLK